MKREQERERERGLTKEAKQESPREVATCCASVLSITSVHAYARSFPCHLCVNCWFLFFYSSLPILELLSVLYNANMLVVSIGAVSMDVCEWSKRFVQNSWVSDKPKSVPSRSLVRILHTKSKAQSAKSQPETANNHSIEVWMYHNHCVSSIAG